MAGEHSRTDGAIHAVGKYSLVQVFPIVTMDQ